MKFIFIMSLFFFAFSFALPKSIVHAQGNHDGHGVGKLQQGRYYGYVKFDGRKERVAVEADFFLESPEDFTQFPHMEAILKLSLGGYHTKEYLTFVFQNLHYDFDNGVLALDEISNDLSVNAKVHSMGGRAHLEGQVWSRSAAIGGVIELLSESDEPDDEPPEANENDKIPFTPLLDGQYHGLCKGKEAVFQIQTLKGFNMSDSASGKTLFDYGIVARLAYRRTGVGRPDYGRPWDVHASFAGGVYSPYRGQLIFLGPATTTIECNQQQTKLSCRYRLRDAQVLCEFDKEDKTIKAIEIFPRKNHVVPTSEQRKELPIHGAISDAQMASILGGHFTGYLHHESSDSYQTMAMHVVARVSSENPHNPNKVFVSSTSILYFGGESSDLFISQRYEPRSFYIRPGFTIGSPNVDSFIVIEEWKTGYIRGVWYSKSFGRVGTVELIKGPMPTLPVQANLIQKWNGEYQRTINSDGDKFVQWFKLIVPNIPAERTNSMIAFQGSYQVIVGATIIESIEKGFFDPYTGELGWSFIKNEGLSMVTGHLAGDGSLLIYWPPAPHLFLATMGDYKLESFKKKNE
jgi:hypothetical protein